MIKKYFIIKYPWDFFFLLSERRCVFFFLLPNEKKADSSSASDLYENLQKAVALQGLRSGKKTHTLYCYTVKKQLHKYSLHCIFYISGRIPSVTLAVAYIPCYTFSIFKRIAIVTCQQYNTAEIEMKLCNVACYINQTNVRDGAEKQKSIAAPSFLQ